MMDTSGIKALFFDFDNTLYSWQTRRIPDSTVHAINRAHQRGIKLFIATGRHLMGLPPEHISTLPFDGFVCLNGAHSWSDGVTIHTNPIPREDVAVFVDFIKSNGGICQLFGTDEVISTPLNTLAAEAFASVGITPPPPRDIACATEKDILQIDFFLNDNSPLKILDDMPNCRHTWWHPSAIDILSNNGGKWLGVTKMAEHFGLRQHEIMVFGDNQNDIDMLENAAFSVALGNGTPEARAAAKFVTDDIDSNGVFNAMRTLLPQLDL